MAQVVTVTGRPSARYDELPWTQARIEESATETGVFTVLETVDLDPVDDDPENPAVRHLTTDLASDTDGYWYRLVFLDDAGFVDDPTLPVQNVVSVVSTILAAATTTELARILKIRTPSAEQTTAMTRVLASAAGEVASEIGSTGTSLVGWQVHLAVEVALERAVEHWRQMEAPFGLIGLGPELPAERTARDSWDRHAHKLAPLKNEWGIA